MEYGVAWVIGDIVLHDCCWCWPFPYPSLSLYLLQPRDIQFHPDHLSHTLKEVVLPYHSLLGLKTRVMNEWLWMTLEWRWKLYWDATCTGLLWDLPYTPIMPIVTNRHNESASIPSHHLWPERGVLIWVNLRCSCLHMFRVIVRPWPYTYHLSYAHHGWIFIYYNTSVKIRDPRTKGSWGDCWYNVKNDHSTTSGEWKFPGR